VQPRSSRRQATTAIDDRLIEDVVRRIVEHFHPRRIILFDSHARGEADAGSDLDLLVEVESDRPLRERAIEISRLFGLHWWPMDILVYTPEEAARVRRDPASLINVIEAEGEVLYARDSGAQSLGEPKSGSQPDCHPERSEGSGTRLDAERCAHPSADNP
jgi:uncharacterized protein